RLVVPRRAAGAAAARRARQHDARGAALRGVAEEPGEERARAPAGGPRCRAGPPAGRAIAPREDGGAAALGPRAALPAHPLAERLGAGSLRPRSAAVGEGSRR